MHLYFITPCVDISILLMHAHDHISQDTLSALFSESIYDEVNTTQEHMRAQTSLTIFEVE